ncbi:glycosyltransferase family 4 protein [Marinobacter sp. W-8]|uniref:glycosyltransferase family 4 protein n=1 Tax=Marinobacter sp. W-8 TaxID=3369658 RepID=UPI0037CAD796
MDNPLGVWFPTVRSNTGTDVFTERLVQNLNEEGFRAEISWLPLRAEYAPWTVPVPTPPSWATVAHVNTWLHPRFLPQQLPVIATLHHSIHDPALAKLKGFARNCYHRWWIAPNERRVMELANRVVAVSHYAANIGRKTLLDIPIEVIYNGVDIQRFHPSTDERKPHKPFRLLYVGSWKALKGVDLLAPIMRELGEDFELYYTGGPTANRSKPFLPPNMHDIGRLQTPVDVVAAMQTADAFVFPSLSEGFGLVAAEAMACGLPVIASRGSSLAEVIEDRKTGLLCSPSNVNSFVSAIKKIFNNEDLRRKISNLSRQHAKVRFSHTKSTSQYLEVYLNETTTI